MTKCITCNDRRVVWSTGDFGMATAKPCPKCNLNGNYVRNQIDEIERSRKETNHNGK